MLPPINIEKWLKENGDILLKPPVNNYCIYRSNDYTVMLIGGPNKRSDYHINPTDEFFYQHKGSMLLKLVVPRTETSEGGDAADSKLEFKDVILEEGDMLLVPGNTPHNPVRYADTLGLVIEVTRPAGQLDTLRWYCENVECREIVFQDSFYCTDLGTQLKPVIEGWANDPEKRYAHAHAHENAKISNQSTSTQSGNAKSAAYKTLQNKIKISYK